MHLFMVYLGGEAQNANIEVHDVQFVIGNTIEETFEQLRNNWFGIRESLHLDSYKKLRGADGFAITIKKFPQESPDKLFFVNVGGYQKESLAEQHQFTLLVARDEQQAKKRALQILLPGAEQKHKDDLRKIDDCLQLEKLGEYFVHLTYTGEQYDLFPDWYGYRLI